jgi:hypothetical protein
MKITRKFLIIVAVVLALVVMATPVIASSKIIRLEQSSFTVTFNVGACQIVTSEYSTKHFLFNKPIASTNVGTATASGTCPPIDVGGVPVIIPIGVPVPFAVVDIRNPGNDTVIKTYAMVMAPASGGDFLGLPVPSNALVQAGANAELINRGHQSLQYEGYVYVYTTWGYLVAPFTAQGHPDEEFVVQPGP